MENSEENIHADIGGKELKDKKPSYWKIYEVTRKNEEYLLHIFLTWPTVA